MIQRENSNRYEGPIRVIVTTSNGGAHVFEGSGDLTSGLANGSARVVGLLRDVDASGFDVIRDHRAATDGVDVFQKDKRKGVWRRLLNPDLRVGCPKRRMAPSRGLASVEVSYSGDDAVEQDPPEV